MILPELTPAQIDEAIADIERAMELIQPRSRKQEYMIAQAYWIQDNNGYNVPRKHVLYLPYMHVRIEAVAEYMMKCGYIPCVDGLVLAITIN